MEKETNSRTSSGPSYEVFLSFRGPDTRYGFADCLYHGMVAAGILVFRDNESLRVGERIGGELLQAIEKSKIYIPIFSTNYASSHWCLRELAYMVECASKSNGNKEILPIFFDVEPVDVKLKTNLYRQTLSKRQKTFCSTEVESWEKALTEVGKIKGWNLKKDEGQGDLIQSVIQAVLVKLNVRYKNVTEDPIGVDDRVEAIIKMLDVESDGVQFLTIHGMGGVGKTTLAKVVFNRLSSLFQGCNFLSDIRESSERHGLVYLQKQLLSKFLDSRSVDQIHDVDDGINMIKRVLCNKKVLIVLDDVDEKRQLRSLVEKGNWFGSGSRIIITTRYKSVLMIEGEATSEGPVKSANVSTYEVQEMEFHHALKLFSRHAFRRDSPPDQYVPLLEKVVFTLGKLPLALEVTGSSLSGKSEKFWVDTLKKLEKAPSIEVQKTLMITYERLDYAQRQVFLDIACFFVNEDKTYPFYMWDDCEYCPHNAIEVLCLMSLIKIKDNNTIWMHDQVRDLGRAIIREENFKDSCERSRVWNHQEALSILKQKEGSRKIEALSLGYRGDIVMHDEVANLRHLRFLEANGVFLIGDFNNLLSNLRWLSWRWCPYEFMATNFHLTNLVILDLSHSYVSEKWIGWNQIKVASKLKVLDLTNCNYLRRTPDISTLVSLERLILEGCCNLIEIDPSIGKLKLLTTLNLNGCKSLVVLPEEIGCLEALTKILMPCSPYGFKLPETFGNLRSLLSFDVSHRQISKLPHSIGGLVKLRRLNLSGCTKIKELPDSVWKLQSLFELDLSLTSLGHLSDSICNLKQLKVLRMSRVSGITKLPSAIGLLEKIEELDISGCQNLTDEIPKEIGRLSCLRLLDLSHTHISILPDSIGNLKQLKVLRMSCISGITKLPSAIGLLEKLEELDISGCQNLTGKIPEEIGRLSCLSILDLSRTYISRLPDSIGHLKELKVLRMSHITRITKLPSTIGLLEKLEELDASGCRNLTCKISKEIGGLFCLSVLDLSHTRLSILADSIGNLKQLKVLRVSSISGTTKLPSAIGLVEKLEVLDVSGCRNLASKILEEIGRLSYLSILDLSRTCISTLPDSIGNLKQLKVLRMSHISGITKLPSAIGQLEKLEELDASRCQNLTGKIPEEIGRLSCLSILNLSYTHISGIPTTVSRLSNLQILNLESCPKLKQLLELPPSLTCLRCAPYSFRYFCAFMQFDGESSSALSTSIYPPHVGYTPIQPVNPTLSLNPTLSPIATTMLVSRNIAWPARENLVNAGLSDFSISINLWTSRLDSSSMSDFAGTFCVELEVLQLHKCKLGKPEALFQLEMDRLRHLEMCFCKFLPKVLDLSHMKNLQEVHLLGFESVEIRGLEELGFLGYLLVMDCRSMERMSDLSKLRKLRKLRVGNCNMLRSVEGLNHLESLQKLWIHDCRSLESLADTSNLELECSQIVRCGWMPDRRNCCKRGRAYCHCVRL